MSVCTLIAADHPLPEVAPKRVYPLEIDPDRGTVYDGDADDHFTLERFPDIEDYTERKYGVSLTWHYYTRGRAARILEYIREALKHSESVELWRVWLGYYEFEDRPFVHRRTVHASALSEADIRALEQAEIWNRPDREYPDRPSFYCLTVIR